MKTKWLLFFLSLFILNITQADNSSRVAVFYYDDPSVVENTTWQYQTVGFGVQSQLKQLLLDQNYSSLQLVDEKRLAPETNQSKQAVWLLAPERVNETWLRDIAKRYDLQLIYWVRINDFLKPAKRLRIGIWSMDSEGIEIELEVCRFNVRTEDYSCYAGSAESSKQLNSFLYQPIEQNTRGHFDYDQAEIGKLSKTALQQAIKQVPE